MSKDNQNVEVVVIYQNSEQNDNYAREVSSSKKAGEEKPTPVVSNLPRQSDRVPSQIKPTSDKPLSHHSQKQKQSSVHLESVHEDHQQPQKDRINPHEGEVMPKRGESQYRENVEDEHADKNGPFEQIIEVPVGNERSRPEEEKGSSENGPKRIEVREDVRVESRESPFLKQEHPMNHEGLADVPRKQNINHLFDVAEGQEEYIKSEEHIIPVLIQDQIKDEYDHSEEVEPLESSQEETSLKANRVIGIVLLGLIGGIFWIYGWASEFHVVTNSSAPVNVSTQAIYGGLLIATTIFTVIGFGLVMMFFKRTSESALFSSLFIVSFTIIVSPIFHKYWYNIFVTDFSGTVISTASPSYLLNQSMGNINILLDLYNLKFSLITSISQLVVLLSMLGKLSYLQLVAFSFFYNFLWPLNHYAMLNIQNKSPDLRFFDDYQISSVYLFAACFGTITMLILKKPPNQESLETSQFSSIFAHIGTFFLYLTFCTTTILFAEKNQDSTLIRNYVWQEAFINCFFALSASALSTYTFSILFNDKIEVRESIFGVLVGGILFGSIAGSCTNIGAAVACGFGAGLLTNLYFHFIYYKINNKRVIDNYGIILMLIVSLIATAIVPSVTLRTYWKFDTILATLQSTSTSRGTTVGNKEVSGYVLAYPAISVLIGCASGLILGLFLKLMDKLDADKTLTNKLYFQPSHGLRPTKQIQPKNKSDDQKKKKKSGRRRIEKQIKKSNPTNELGNSNLPAYGNANMKEQSDKRQYSSDDPVIEIVYEHSSNLNH